MKFKRIKMVQYWSKEKSPLDGRKFISIVHFLYAKNKKEFPVSIYFSGRANWNYLNFFSVIPMEIDDKDHRYFETNFYHPLSINEIK